MTILTRYRKTTLVTSHLHLVSHPVTLALAGAFYGLFSAPLDPFDSI